MSENVFVLGAGASRHAGAPLMKDFLDVAEDIKKREVEKEASNDFDLVFKGLAALKQAHANAKIDTENVESVFAAFEIAKLLGHLGDLSGEEINRLPAAMRRLIQTTLEQSIKFLREEQAVLPPLPYRDFVSLLRDMGFQKVSVITFNYDLCLDYALHFDGVPVNYCLQDEKKSIALKLLKLHGSLNWARCSVCSEVISWHLSDYFKKFDWSLWRTQAKEFRLKVGSRIGQLTHCSTSPEGSMIVPPTWNKAQYHDQLECVWRAAANELIDAENILISGYSLPPTDHFFRYLYALGTMGKARLKRFWVFDPDKGVKERFMDLLGPLASSRFYFDYATFDQAIGMIRTKLNL